MNIIKTDLPEVLLIEPNVFEDDRGFFMESYQKQRFADAGIMLPFVQDNMSRSQKGILRGLHYQHPAGQGKLVSVVEGSVYDVFVDIRRGSPTFGHWTGVEISADNKRLIWIPPGFAHGFCVLTDFALFVYKCTEYYAPDCERTVKWDDPDIGIEWPVDDPILSPKDVGGKYLKDISSEHLPSYDGS